jgi:hypothetical protein
MNSGNAQQLTEVLNSVADGITIQNAQGQLVFVNAAAAKMMGFATPAAAIKAGALKIIAGFRFADEHGRPIPPDDLPGRRALKGEEEPAMVVSYTSPQHPGQRW